MACNSLAGTHSAYNKTWIVVFIDLAIQSKCDKCIRQTCCNILTLVPVFHCGSIKVLYRCTFMACCVAWVPPFITKANPWNCGTSFSINCDWLFHCKSLLKECEFSVIQSVCLWPNSRQILRHQYGVSVTEWQMFFFTKHLPVAMSKEEGLFSQAG